MGFFSGKAAELKEVPLTDAQKRAIRSTRGLLNEPTLPERQVAGMSEAEQATQSILASILGGQAFEDPRTSDLYRGLREESLGEEERGIGALRRRAQMGGMYNSGTSLAEEGRARQGFANDRMSLLGGLYQNERAMDNPYTRLQAGMTAGSLPRLLQQAQQDTTWQNMMDPIQFRYQQIAPIAQALFGMTPTTYMTAPEPSGLSQMAPMLGAGLGGLLGAGPMGMMIGSNLGSAFGGMF